MRGGEVGPAAIPYVKFPEVQTGSRNVKKTIGFTALPDFLAKHRNSRFFDVKTIGFCSVSGARSAPEIFGSKYLVLLRFLDPKLPQWPLFDQKLPSDSPKM